MRKILLILTKNELENFDSFFDKYKNRLFKKTDEKYYFQSDFSFEKEELLIQKVLINFENYDVLEKIIDKLLSQTFLKLKNSKNDIDDFEYRDENDTFLRPMLNICFYEEIKDIFDFMTKLFICTLQNHKLKNGNKRFSFMFLNTLTRAFGYYLKWTSQTKNIDSDFFNINYKKHEYNIYNFVTKLQNRTFNKEDINYLIDKESENGLFLESCLNDIIKNYNNMDIAERHKKVKEEIYIWLKDNIVIKLY